MTRKVGTAHMPTHVKRQLKGSKWPCRFCEHMVRISPPRAHYIGACTFRLRPGPRGGCPKFETARCFRK